MSGAFRTPSGGLVDRSARASFTFDGQPYEGLRSDTLASALLANGEHLVGRSFKYHRPRGILGAGAEEPNALVTIDRGGGRITPNLRATQVELYEGLRAASQNCWPSPRFDVGAAAGIVAPLLPAGFYYKTFLAGGSKAWAKLYEPAIRRAAGLGRAPRTADPDRYAQRYAHCDVLVVGGGPAGVAAALAAGDGGARVILCEQDCALGGALLGDAGATIAGGPASLWLAGATAELARCENVRILSRTQAFGYFPDNFVGLIENLSDHLAAPDPVRPRERLWQVRAREVVLATGAAERPLVFPDNDRPGIMLAGAVRTYLNRYGVRAGTRAVVFTADDAAYQAALDLARAGVAIEAIADLRPADGPMQARARAAGLRVLPATAVTGTRGHLRITRAQLGAVRDDGSAAPREWIACDFLLMSGGWTPQVHLFSQSRGRLRFDAAIQSFVPDVSVQRERSAGACKGAFDLAQCLAEGFAAGEQAMAALGMRARPRARPTAESGAAPGPGHHGAVSHGRDPWRSKAFVDFQNDVTARDIALATQEGFHSIEHVKRYTTTGMATDQGKTSNLNALAVAASALGKDLPAIGLTTFRMPYTPVTMGALAGPARGDLFDPIRTTPIHDWTAAEGAVFEDVGSWKRARYFPRAGESMDRAVARECRATRTSAGIFDASTLGKIEIVGPDAAEFLNLIYTNDLSALAPGRCRYGLMLSEAGFVMDDGVVARLAPDRFHATTTTGGAARVLHHMEDCLQTEFPHLKAWLTSTTEQWAVIAVNGPLARRILEPLAQGVDLSASAMPHMSVREGAICGVTMRLFRVSFTGELGFEVNVPAAHGRMVWEAIWAEGRKHEATVYGTEAMHVLRAEKGNIIVGQETDGTVIPGDLGLDWAIGKRKRDFVGKRSLVRPDMTVADRKQLVGLLTSDPALVLDEGAQVIAGPKMSPGATPALGHVTSSYRSEALGRSIALALVARGRERMGETLYVAGAGAPVPAVVTRPLFYDPQGQRLNG
jgi:sarcosine oxidase subunit alpha